MYYYYTVRLHRVSPYVSELSIGKPSAAKCEFSPLNPLSKSNYALKCSGHSVFPDKFNTVFPFFDNCYHDACYVRSIENYPATMLFP